MEDFELELPSSHRPRSTHIVEANELRKYDYVVLRGRICKIMGIKVLNDGHSPKLTKLTFYGMDIFTDEVYEQTLPATSLMEVPSARVNSQDYKLVDITDSGYLKLSEDVRPVDRRNDVKIKIPDTDLGRDIKEEFEKGESTIFVSVRSRFASEKDEERVICARFTPKVNQSTDLKPQQ